MHVYFDSTLIDDDAIMELSNSHKLYDENFYLGSTVSNSFKLAVDKTAVVSQPDVITLKTYENNVETNYAVLHIDEVVETKYSYEYTLSDAMTLLNFKYNPIHAMTNNTATLLEIVEDICDIVGIELGTNDFRGYDKNITWYDDTINAREYIGYVAELNGGYAIIGTDGKLYFKKQNMNSQLSINVSDCEDFNLGSYHKITRVVYDLGTLHWEYGTDDFDTLYLNNENVYITEQSEVQAIYNDIKDFEFYSINCGYSPIDSDIKSGDVISFVDGNNTYKTIACFDLTYNGGWIGGYKLDIKSFKVEETNNVGINSDIKRIQITVDRDNNQITQLVAKTNNLDNLVNQVVQTQTDSYTKTEIQQIVDGTGVDGVVVSKVITSAGYIFDGNGLKIYTDENSYNALHNNVGTYYKDGDTILSQTTKDGTITKDLALYGTYYYGIDDNLSIENFTKDDAMFISMKYTDNNGDECVGHFYNGND